MTDFRAPCPVGCMWNESGGENFPVDTAPDDQLDVSDVVEHRGEETEETLGRMRHYCDVIIARWEKLTGQKHQVLERLVNNGKE